LSQFLVREATTMWRSQKRKLWERMRRYRLWEANRKVFLYPENYLEPELRDDKTALSKDVEGTLSDAQSSDPPAQNKHT
jgi:hypothetical protein